MVTTVNSPQPTSDPSSNIPSGGYTSDTISNAPAGAEVYTSDGKKLGTVYISDDGERGLRVADEATSTTAPEEFTPSTPANGTNTPTATQPEVTTDTSTPTRSLTEESAPLPEPTKVEVQPAAAVPTVEAGKDAPEEIKPEEDPFEKARQDAEANDNPGPTEQDVIKVSDDPQLTKEQLAKQEEEQEYNRAQLKMQETEAAPGTYGATSVDAVRASQTLAVTRNTIRKDDWRVHLSLAPSAKYLYNLAGPEDILYPVKLTDGVIFPYTPTIQTSFRANYDSADLTHSNYKMYFYKNSSIDEISLTADFTAQDTTEANYMLAVIHFFKSVTKMFYGQDGNNGPKAGTPPPLCYLNGFGQYQFNEHPVLISSFTYNLPNDVDYIRAGKPTLAPGTNTDAYTKPKGDSSGKKGFDLMKFIRTSASSLLSKNKSKGTKSLSEPKWVNYAKNDVTYVPTKMSIQLTLLPIVTRNDISKNFSLEKYASGQLLKGRDRPSGGGIW